MNSTYLSLSFFFYFIFYFFDKLFLLKRYKFLFFDKSSDTGDIFYRQLIRALNFYASMILQDLLYHLVIQKRFASLINLF